MTEKEKALEALLAGHAPEDVETLRRVSVGTEPLLRFLRDHYLSTYIPAGGSKIKFLSGLPGSGKTHVARLLSAEAREMGFLTVAFSAREVAMNDFREIYRQALAQCGLAEVLRGCANRIIRDMDVDPAALAEGQTLMDYLSERGEGDSLARNEIRGSLRKLFTRNPLLDREFGACCSLLVGDMLGHPVLEPANRELIMGWLTGDPAIKARQIRALGMTPVGVTKYNARHLLRSLAEIIHLAGYQGLMITVDDLEALMNRSEENGIKYTKGKRDDAYESIRQLIDEIDTMRYILFVFCLDRALMDNENAGMKTYQALWLRVQNEVVGHRFNGFADILNLDRYADEHYDAPAMLEMAEKLAQLFTESGNPCSPLDADRMGRLMERAKYGSLGLPYMVNRAVAEGEKEDV